MQAGKRGIFRRSGGRIPGHFERGVDAYSQCGYSIPMKTTLIPIGNSRGVRIPKPLIDQCGLTDEVEMDVRDGTILIHAPRKSRMGWEEAFQRMAACGDDKLLDGPTAPTRWEDEEWQWT